MTKLNARRMIGLVLIIVGVALPLIYFSQATNQVTVAPTITPTAIVERLVPSVPPKPLASRTSEPTATATATIEPLPTDRPTATPTATKKVSAATQRPALITASITSTPRPTRAATPTATSIPLSAATSTTKPIPPTIARPTAPTAAPAPNPIGPPYSTRQRFGVGIADGGTMRNNSLGKLGVGWNIVWGVYATDFHASGVEFVQTVRLQQGRIRSGFDQIVEIARQQPGAMWLISNEPDVIWQDNTTPEQYATAYHTLYAALKEADPTSRIAAGGISQPTPLRRQYLDHVLAEYRKQFGEEMPVDVWNIHNFILQEKRGDWGVDIPPGMSANSGELYTIDDHDNLDIFRQQIVDFRRWMNDRGYAGKELIVSEYGILMYADYGFDTPRVSRFMLGTFDYFMTAADGVLGMPADGHHLVQRWCWYSLGDSGQYPTGNLVDPDTAELTELGRDFATYIHSH